MYPILSDIASEQLLPLHDSTSEQFHDRTRAQKQLKPGNVRYDAVLYGATMGSNYGTALTAWSLYCVLKKFLPKVLWAMAVNCPAAYEWFDDKGSAFVKKHVEDKVFCHLSMIDKLNDFTDTFVLGSDQVWRRVMYKRFGKSFHLDFTANSKKRVSYASSFGVESDSALLEEKDDLSLLFKRFDAISVREQSGVDILRENYGVDAKQVCDPVILGGVETLLPLATDARLDVQQDTPFILCYFLSPTKEKCRLTQHVSNKFGLPFIVIPNGAEERYGKDARAYWIDTMRDAGFDDVATGITAEDLIYLYNKTSYVITDSYHGTILSTLFHKPFVTFDNSGAGSERMRELFRVIGHKERYITDHSEAIPIFDALTGISFEAIDASYSKERARSLEWLKTALEKPKKQLNSVPDRLYQSKCVGCGACVSACPVDSLSLSTDKWGFYRSVLRSKTCTNCGKCQNVCPALRQPTKNNDERPTLLAIKCSDEKLLNDSSSGGAFSLIADKIFELGGLVCGAAWREDFTVEHILIDNQADMSKLRKSKYLQSYLGNIFRVIRQQLEKGRFVLFSACPCQCAGLSAFLNRQYDNLLVVDLLCGNAPSAAFFRKYLQESFPDGVKEYIFRHKIAGWNPDCLTLTLINGTVITRKGGKEDLYQKVYHSHVMTPPHCEKCVYQALPRYGDITIGDFWGIKEKDDSIDVTNGVSAVLINNKKGKEFIDKISKVKFNFIRETPLDWLGINGFAVKGHNGAPVQKRDRFFAAILKSTFEEAVKLALDCEIDYTKI
jgi:coenzyme F420-reducing hydrogenase beta subunit